MNYLHHFMSHVDFFARLCVLKRYEVSVYFALNMLSLSHDIQIDISKKDRKFIFKLIPHYSLINETFN